MVIKHTFTLEFNRVIAETKQKILVEATCQFVSQFVILDKADVLPGNKAAGNIDDVMMFDLESEALEHFNAGA